MKLEYVRALDRYAGPAVCLGLTAWERIARLLRGAPRQGRENVRRILFIKLSEIGAVLCALPFFRKVKAEYPDAETVLVTFAKNEAVFGLLAGDIGADHVLTIRIDTPGCFIADTAKVAGFLLSRRFDIAFDLELFARFSIILAYLSGAARRVGFFRYTVEGVYRGDLLTHRVQFNPLIHISRSFYSLYLALSKPAASGPELGGDIPEGELVLPVCAPSDEALARVEEVLQRAGVLPGQKIILLHIGDGLLPLREWPLEHYSLLVQKLARRNDVFLVFVGTHCDDEAIGRLTAWAPGRCLNLNRRTSMPELMALFHLGTLVFSTDCGLMHLAALSRIHKVVIFGPESPAVFAPLGGRVRILYKGLPCSPCFLAYNHRSSACRDNLCIRQVAPEEVFQVISEYL